MKINKIRELIASRGLKVTPQRVIVLSSLHRLRTHPAAENLIEFIRIEQPNIAVGTIYHILDTFIEKGLIRKVKTNHDVMRYDAILDKHHHLHYTDSDKIADYYDEELNIILEEYFKSKRIPGFIIEDVNLDITGHYTDSN
ncbi:MAG: transcriptional repressor [Bacteroidales bacterium]|nr:transcriptional repressor [Bacteroidales bacterium]